MQIPCPLRAHLHGAIFVPCDNGLRQAHDMILGRFTRYDFCRMRQWLTTGPRHDLRLLCTSEKMSLHFKTCFKTL